MKIDIPVRKLCLTIQRVFAASADDDFTEKKANIRKGILDTTIEIKANKDPLSSWWSQLHQPSWGRSNTERPFHLWKTEPIRGVPGWLTWSDHRFALSQLNWQTWARNWTCQLKRHTKVCRWEVHELGVCPIDPNSLRTYSFFWMEYPILTGKLVKNLPAVEFGCRLKSASPPGLPTRYTTETLDLERAKRIVNV